MRRRVVILAVLFVCRDSFGAALVGPSTALLEGDRFGLSLEYSQIDADLAFDVDGTGPAEDFDLQTTYAGFAAALTERWDFFIRLGAGRADAAGFDGDTDFSWGMGTRFTAFQGEEVSWGALAQFTTVTSQQDTVAEFLVDDVPTLLEVEDELDLVEYVFATGPTWRHGPLAVYGGLLVRYVTGEFQTDAGVVREKFDIDRQWDAGGYVGGRFTLFQAATPHTYGIARGDLTVEGRFTDDSSGFSVGLLLPFGGPL
jgi:hypothetical protein